MASTDLNSVFLSGNLRDEPSIDELFAEHIIQLVMKRDGVHAQEMRRTIDTMLEACPA